MKTTGVTVVRKYVKCIISLSIVLLGDISLAFQRMHPYAKEHKTSKNLNYAVKSIGIDIGIVYIC